MPDGNLLAFDGHLNPHTLPTVEKPLRRFMRDIIVEVAYKHGVTVDDIKGERRFRKIATARFEFWYRVADELPYVSWYQMAMFTGGRDHSTALNGAYRYAEVSGWPRPATRARSRKK